MKNNLNPRFTTTIQMDYRFEEVQPLRFAIFDIDNATSSLDDDDFLGDMECTLAEVGVALRSLLIITFSSPFKDCEFFIVHTTFDWRYREEVQS